MTYSVLAKRWEGGWELHIEGVGVTQTANLTGADRMVRDYLRLDGYADHATAALDLAFDGVGDAPAAFTAARNSAEEARRMARDAGNAARQAVYQLVAVAGLSGQEAARVLGISAQRVSQLLPGGSQSIRKGRTPVKVAASGGAKAGKLAAPAKATVKKAAPAKAVVRKAAPAKASVKKAAPMKKATPARVAKGAHQVARGRSKV